MPPVPDPQKQPIAEFPESLHACCSPQTLSYKHVLEVIQQTCALPCCIHDHPVDGHVVVRVPTRFPCVTCAAVMQLPVKAMEPPSTHCPLRHTFCCCAQFTSAAPHSTSLSPVPEVLD